MKYIKFVLKVSKKLIDIAVFVKNIIVILAFWITVYQKIIKQKPNPANKA